MFAAVLGGLPLRGWNRSSDGKPCALRFTVLQSAQRRRSKYYRHYFGRFCSGGWDSQISFSVTHGWSAFGGADHGWQDIGLAGGSLDAGSSRFWIGWVTRRGDKCVRSTCRG